MKKLIVLSFFGIFLFSCQKEISYEDPNSNPPGGGGGGGGNTTPTQLFRVGTRSGADSSTIEYTYSSNRITGYTVGGTAGGQPIDAIITYTRNASNVITQETYKSSALAQYGLTQVVTNHNYDAAASKYTTSVTVIPIAMITIRDSIVYTYDAGGKLTTSTDYLDDGSGSGYAPVSKIEYTYSGNNIATAKYYSYDDQTSAFVLEETGTYEYDTKTNPLQFASDAVVLGMRTFYSANNITKITVTETSPAQTTVITNTYTYNTANRPIKVSSSDGTDTSVSSYYYQ